MPEWTGGTGLRCEVMWEHDSFSKVREIPMRKIQKYAAETFELKLFVADL